MMKIKNKFFQTSFKKMNHVNPTHKKKENNM